jgi:hypothetical protein
LRTLRVSREKSIFESRCETHSPRASIQEMALALVIGAVAVGWIDCDQCFSGTWI